MNGTMVDAATYYSGSSTYTGEAGTETNPYCVEDIYDLLAINTYTNSTLFFMLVENIDFNDHPTYKYGLTTSTSLISKSQFTLLGNGKEIRNVIAKYKNGMVPIFKLNKVKNLKFLNFINLNSGLYPFDANLESCQISGYYSSPYTSYFVSDSSSTIEIKNCSINIKGNIGDRTIQIKNLTNTHVNFDVTTTNKILFDNNSTAMSNSYITGKAKIMSSSDIVYILNKCENWKNSYIAIEVETTSTVKLLSSTTYNPSSVTFVDKELAGITSENEQSLSNLYYLTTEQCKSAEYLDSIGFLTVPTT